MSLFTDALFPAINDWVLGPAVDGLRAEVVACAHGRVLELGAGSGLNFRFYASDADVEALEPGAGMRRRAEVRARGTLAHIVVRHGKARQLPFDAGRFDAVVATFVLCSVPDLAGALAEIHRVLRPGGQLLAVEHVLDADPAVARWQHRVQPAWGIVFGGCHVNRDIRREVEASAFDVQELVRTELPLPRIARAGVRGRAVRI